MSAAATAMAPGSSPLPGVSPEVTALLMDSRTLRPFKSSEEYLYAMREDLAEWLNALYPEIAITVDLFMDRLEDGVALCKHANNVRRAAREHAERRLTRSMSRSGGALLVLQEPKWPAMSPKDVQFRAGVKPGTFLARDNVSNFITWCRHDLGVLECLLFETDDLILRKNEKHVVLCLMEVARRGAKFGVPAPMLVQFEREIDREIARDQKRERAGSSSGDGVADAGDGAGADDEEEEEEEEDYPLLQYGPVPQIVTNDLKSLDEMVRDLLERCTCPTQFPMIRVSEGKYRIGDTKVLIFVRILRKHVMVRVGGGWDTLSHYLDKHDPCRCRAGHRGLAGSTRLITKSGNQVDLNTAQVHYDRYQYIFMDSRSTPGSPPRTRRSSTSSVGSGGTPQVPASPARGARQRSRSPRPPAQQQRSRSPRPPVTITAASDSGSEVSDEGYRSLGVNNKLLPPGIDEADTHERPESAMTNTSDCSSSTPDDTLPPPRRIPTSRRSASPCVRKDAPDTRRATTPSRSTGPLPRSRSVSGEPGINTLSPTKSPLSRNALGYRSVRTKSTTNPPEQQNTWNAPRSNKSRPTISQDTFQPFGPPSVRRSLPSRSHPSSTHSTPTRKPSRQQSKQQSSTPTSPSKHVSPILQQILATSESTRNEDEFLQNLRQIINQYEHKIPPAAADTESLTREWVQESEYGKPVLPTPRKSSHDDNDTRIPVPTFYKQSSKGALIDSAATSSTVTPSGLDTTCCL